MSARRTKDNDNTQKYMDYSFFIFSGLFVKALNGGVDGGAGVIETIIVVGLPIAAVVGAMIGWYLKKIKVNHHDDATESKK